MGIEIYPPIVRECLTSLNRSLEPVRDNSLPFKASIDEFVETADLRSVAFGSRKDYMSRGHLPVIDAQLSAVNQFMEANNTHIGYIDSYLGGEGYLSEERLTYQIECLAAYITTAENLHLNGVAQLLYTRQQSCREKLEKLYTFASVTANLYDGVEVALTGVEARISALEGAVYNSSSDTYFLPVVETNTGNMTEVKFIQMMAEQFGFDKKTAQIMFQIYGKIQVVYGNLSEKEREWCFARALSQLGDYNSMQKKVFFMTVETHAWRKGAGWVYEYEKEEEFFCNTLSLSKEDYSYLRQMIRLQHFMTSQPDKFSYEMLCALQNEDPDDFQLWKENMEKGVGKSLTDAEYKEYYKKLWNQFSSTGDYSHMLYTIAANLNDDKYKVDNKWNNPGDSVLSWKNAEERKDVTGWLGDAVYTGDENQVSFGNDDYIADLDADNIAHRAEAGGSLLNHMGEYYQNLTQGNADAQRIKEFLRNNPYEDVEKAILDRISVQDLNQDGKKTVEDLKDNSAYVSTYDFLKKIEKYKVE